jgi:hypothetical protein
MEEYKMTYASSEISIDNVLIAFDAETLLEVYPNPSLDPDNPTAVQNADKVIFMMTKKGDTLCGHGASELNFTAQPSDIIRWRETTLERNTGRNVQLYKYQAWAGGNLLAAPAIQPVNVTIPIPNPADPVHPTNFQKVADYLWQSTALDTGTVVYTFSFVVLKRDGTPLGYFRWDPYITITSN